MAQGYHDGDVYDGLSNYVEARPPSIYRPSCVYCPVGAPSLLGVIPLTIAGDLLVVLVPSISIWLVH